MNLNKEEKVLIPKRIILCNDDNVIRRIQVEAHHMNQQYIENEHNISDINFKDYDTIIIKTDKKDIPVDDKVFDGIKAYIFVAEPV